MQLLRRTMMIVCLGVVTGLFEFGYADGKSPHIVMLIAESEYGTEATLEAFAKAHLKDFRVTTVLADPGDPNALPGIESIAEADLVIISVRRRALPKEQLDRVRAYVAAGKPMIGIRTASHAFSLREQDPPRGRAVWPEFDAEVFGGHYTNHHGNSLQTTVTAVENLESADTRLLRGVLSALPAKSGGSLYRVSPLAQTAEVLLMGRVEGASPEPVAWTFRRRDGGKSFYTSLGHVDDFQGGVLPGLLRNAIDWALAP
jgi:type 1 glutamine amidotransferase